MLTLIEKEIKYSRETRDYDCYVDGRYVGSRSTYSQADHLCCQVAADLIADGETLTAAELDGGAEVEQVAADTGLMLMPEGDILDTDGMRVHPHYTRRPAFDNERHGCAWVDRLGLTRWLPAGVDPNA